MFIKFFHALYERLSYAKILVREKIQADLAEMTLQEKVDLGLMNNPEERKLDDELIEQLVKERYEHLLKGIFATTTGQSYSGSMPSAMVTALQGGGHGSHNHYLMDHNRYEDFARQLLGKNAFLLFQIDKILSQSIKQLAQMPSDSVVQKAFKLFGSAQGSAGPSERHYLANYVEQIVDQMNLGEHRGKPRSGQIGEVNALWSADDRVFQTTLHDRPLDSHST